MPSESVEPTAGVDSAPAVSPAAIAPAAENRGDLLRKSNWERIIGTWVDADTKGAAYKTTYAWKYKEWVAEFNIKEGNQHSVSLMGLNAQTGEVFRIGVDSERAGRCPLPARTPSTLARHQAPRRNPPPADSPADVSQVARRDTQSATANREPGEVGWRGTDRRRRSRSSRACRTRPVYRVEIRPS